MFVSLIGLLELIFATAAKNFIEGFWSYTLASFQMIQTQTREILSESTFEDVDYSTLVVVLSQVTHQFFILPLYRQTTNEMISSELPLSAHAMWGNLAPILDDYQRGLIKDTYFRFSIWDDPPLSWV